MQACSKSLSQWNYRLDGLHREIMIAEKDDLCSPKGVLAVSDPHSLLSSTIKSRSKLIPSPEVSNHACCKVVRFRNADGSIIGPLPKESLPTDPAKSVDESLPVEGDTTNQIFFTSNKQTLAAFNRVRQRVQKRAKALQRKRQLEIHRRHRSRLDQNGQPQKKKQRLSSTGDMDHLRNLLLLQEETTASDTSSTESSLDEMRKEIMSMVGEELALLNQCKAIRERREALARKYQQLRESEGNEQDQDFVLPPSFSKSIV